MPGSIYNSLLLPDLRLMLEERDDLGMAEFCNVLLPAVAAEVLEGVDAERTWEVLKHCSPERQAEIFPFFSLAYQVDLVDSVPKEDLSKIIEEMASDDRVDLLERMDADHRESLLRLVAQAERAEIRKLLSYPEGSAGSIMTTEYASLPADITVRDALEQLRVQAPSRETIYYIYVTDDARRLKGFISLRKIIQARPNTLLADIMDRDVISVHVDDDQEAVANEVYRYGFIAIPVVDADNRLVGIVTHDDAAEVLREEATADAQLQAAVTPLEDGYIDTPFFELAWKRGTWLVILLGAASMTAKVLHLFEPGDAGDWMVLFLPMVLASGGNSGSQSATLIIRALALNETEGRVGWIAWREARMGAFLGLLLATMSYAVARLMVGHGPALVVTLTVFSVVAMGALVGAMLPLGLKRFGLDPAFMSNPLIAALSDMSGVVIYYSAAAWLVLGSPVAAL